MPIEGLSSWTASIGISASLNFCLACTRQALINTGLKSPLALYQRCGERLGQLADQFLQTRNIFRIRSEEHTSELQSLMRISYAVFCLKKKKYTNNRTTTTHITTT